MKLHHLGISVKSINNSVKHYQNSLNWHQISSIIYDPVQDVNITFMSDGNNILYELIEPSSVNSPISGLLKKRISLYHVCYEVGRIQDKINELEKKGFLKILGPVAAVAFDGRKVAFLINSDNLTIELLEK
jgi:Glyoxalase/Bleomycin resistance protein/Dioxygenase superfamily